MRFIVPYFAGIFAALFTMAAAMLGELIDAFIGISLAVIVTFLAALYCYKRHKKKQKEYYDRFSVRSKGLK